MPDTPSRMTKEERLSEVAEIMAAAVVRLKNRKPRKNIQNPLDYSHDQRMYETREGGEKP